VSATVAAVVLLVLIAPLLYLNLYFLLLVRDGWAGAAKRVGFLLTQCNLDTSVCQVVVRTGWARAILGIPNTVFGLIWCGALLWLAVTWLQSGVVTVPWWALAGAAATVLGAVVLIWALLVRLKQPCPL
jgi:uncharacterized membrane protein